MPHTPFRIAAATTVALAVAASAARADVAVSSCRRITQPGKYRLTKNIEAKESCFILNANDVEIDLDGHLVQAVAVSRAGIEATGLNRNIVVRNGTISGFQRGIDLFDAIDVRVENMQIRNNAGVGIFVSHNAIVTGNLVTENEEGILARPQSSFVGDGGLFADNVVTSNRRNGMRIETPGSLLRGNVLRRNKDDGINVVCPANLIGNAATSNGIGTSGENLDDNGTTGCVLSQNLTTP